MAFSKDQGLAFLESNRSHIEAKVYEKKYKKITYPEVIPVSMEAGEWAESIIYYYMDASGMAKWIGDKAFDVPMAESATNKVSIPVRMAGIGYQYSLEELGVAASLGIPLTDRKASSARKGSEEFIQKTAYLGDATVGFNGFLNHPNVPTANVVDPGAGTEWVNKTPDQILFDINDMFGDINSSTGGNESADTLALPIAQWNYIMGTPRSANSDTTIGQYIANNSPFLDSVNDIIKIEELAGIGAGSTDRMMAYTRDPDKVVMHLPMPFRFLPAQEKGLGFEVPGMTRVGGVEFRYTQSASYRDGI